jgi:hypothetical protein
MMIAQNQLPLPTFAECASQRQARRVGTYQAVFQRKVRDLAALSPALEDLAESFPALLFALATGYGNAEQRALAIDCVVSGASLRQAADALGLPHWLRKLPASAFTAPLVTFPLDAEFSVRMASLVPTECEIGSSWLGWVSEAVVGGGEGYALWMARYGHAVVRHLPHSNRRLMAAWSWFSQHPECSAAQLLRRRWTADMAPRRALDEFQAWRDRLALADWLGSGRMEPWLAAGTAQGFSFEPLTTAASFVAVASALDNCLDQYAHHLRRGTAMVVAVRKGGRLVACVEIGLNETELTMPSIVQLRGIKNRRVGPDVWQAAFQWLGSQAIEPFCNGRLTPAVSDRTKARRDLWRSYFEHLDAMDGQGAMVSDVKKQIRKTVSSNGSGAHRSATVGGAAWLRRTA